MPCKESESQCQFYRGNAAGREAISVKREKPESVEFADFDVLIFD